MALTLVSSIARTGIREFWGVRGGGAEETPISSRRIVSVMTCGVTCCSRILEGRVSRLSRPPCAERLLSTVVASDLTRGSSLLVSFSSIG
eukprot:scaffold129776_cov30-Tisochrysis_lutea.AAC.2